MGVARCRGCGTSGSGERPLQSAVLLPPWSPPRQVKMLQEGKMQERAGHWDLLVVNSSLVVMETVIWLYLRG